MSWTNLTEWWLTEIVDDPAYEEVVTPLELEVLPVRPGKLYLDLGCGEGRVMRPVRETGALVHGLDLNADLAARATGVVAELPAIPLRESSYDGVYLVLTLEHIEDHDLFFSEAARVTRPGGVMGIVINHPAWTAPGSTPITDEDGEILWRPGEYFSSGTSELAAGGETVTFHHRSMAALLNAAAEAGWALEQMIERPHHSLEDQGGIPRLLACRWRLPI